MDIVEVREKRDELQKEILRLLMNFHKDTGCIAQVSVDYTVINTFSGPRQYVSEPQVVVEVSVG